MDHVCAARGSKKVVFHILFLIFRYLSFVRKSFAVLARVADRPGRGRPQVARV
jgi:hypothetical protein